MSAKVSEDESLVGKQNEVGCTHSAIHKPHRPECVNDAMPALFGTGALYPFRDQLFDKGSDREEAARQVIAHVLGEMVDSHPKLSTFELVDKVQELLCGTEPLTRRQMLFFLECAADVVRGRVQDRVRAWKHSKPDRDTAEMATPSNLSCELETDDRLLGAKGGLGFAAHQSRFGMDLYSVSVSPADVEQRLALLESMEAEKPDVALWIRLIEFTGATNDELADYFRLPEETINRSLDKSERKFSSTICVR